MTAAIVAADVVPLRSDTAINIPRRIRIEDCIPDFTVPPQTPPQVTAELPLTVLLTIIIPKLPLAIPPP
jgi:hypothetical protein